MTPDYLELATDLQTRFEIIANSHLREHHPEEQLRRLQQISERLTSWHQQFRKDIPAQLHHFLQQQSLTKALDYLKTEGLI